MVSTKLRNHWLAHWFGCGLLPKAPGTFGTLGAIPLHLLLVRLNPIVHAGLVVALTLVGIGAAQAASRAAEDEDPSAVVIDEVAGMLIAGWFVRNEGFIPLIAAFALFRLLDIAKPGVIDKAQHLGPPGVSIMLDDVLAGFGAGLGAWAVGWFV